MNFDIVVGLFRLLGYWFSPRIADVGGTGLWRRHPRPGRRRLCSAERDRRNEVNLDRIVAPWPDMLRVAGSLITNQVRA